MSSSDGKLFYPPPPNVPHPAITQAQQETDERLAQDLQARYDAEAQSSTHQPYVAPFRSSMAHGALQANNQQSQPNIGGSFAPQYTDHPAEQIYQDQKMEQPYSQPNYGQSNQQSYTQQPYQGEMFGSQTNHGQNIQPSHTQQPHQDEKLDSQSNYAQSVQRDDAQQPYEAQKFGSQANYGQGVQPSYTQQAYQDQKFNHLPQQAPPPYGGEALTVPSHHSEYNPPLPPRRSPSPYLQDTTGIDYTRDPHKLVAYLIPFPKPRVANVDPARIPDRFLIYTPPAPPLQAPVEGEKETRAHKLQRKWQEEVKTAKLSDAKVNSWKGAKGRATKGISYAMSWVKSSNLEFLNRVPDGSSDKHAEDGVHEGDTTHRTVGLTEMLLIYPSSLQGTPDQIRASFVETMLRTKSQAQKDAILATGLLPIAFAVDICATLIWPFGGLAEIDGVWAYASIRGAKTARSVSKRLNSSATDGDAHSADEKQKLALNFTPSNRLEVLRRYLAAECQARDAALFAREGPSPTETDVLQAIGWTATSASAGGETRNWEDEQWEMKEVKDDIKQVMGKAAKEWGKWCKLFVKDPEKAMKK